MATGIAWVLNLDADLELGAEAAGGGGRRYGRTGPVARAMKVPAERLARRLLGPGDLLIDERSDAGVAHGRVGRAFCPTPGALAVLRRGGAHPEPSPPVDVLRRVNSRAFAAALGPTLPGAAFVTELGVAITTLRGRPPVGEAWRVKYAFGMAGRNQRVVSPSSLDAHLAFIGSGLARGGLQIEPNVAIEEEYAVHAFLPWRGPAVVGAVVGQRCDARGAWLATEPLASTPLAIADAPERLAEECRRVANALAAAGYFGPFGVDAYSYRDDKGVLCLQPRSEINARYSMGFPEELVPPRSTQETPSSR
jgi:hypothetical protein